MKSESTTYIEKQLKSQFHSYFDFNNFVQIFGEWSIWEHFQAEAGLNLR